MLRSALAANTAWLLGFEESEQQPRLCAVVCVTKPDVTTCPMAAVDAEYPGYRGQTL